MVQSAVGGMRTCAVVMLLMTPVLLLAQSPVERAVVLGKSGEWKAGLRVLEPAMGEPDLRSDAHAWYVLGFIQKELHKIEGTTAGDSPERLAAVGSLERAWSLKPNPNDAELIREVLDFLGRSFFRDAMLRIDGFTPGSDGDILALFGRYKAIALLLDSGADLTDQEADLYRYLGQANGLLIPASRSTENEQLLFNQSVAHYEKALSIHPDDYAGQYNLAITVYNQGVRQLKRINHETSMFELMEIQDACVGLFERALIPMERAHAMKPGRLETLKGLMTIHHALSQPEESERYRAAIQRQIDKAP